MINKRKIGKTDIEVSELGFGCAPLGGWPVAVSDQDANLSLETANKSSSPNSVTASGNTSSNS